MKTINHVSQTIADISLSTEGRLSSTKKLNMQFLSGAQRISADPRTSRRFVAGPYSKLIGRALFCTTTLLGWQSLVAQTTQTFPYTGTIQTYTVPAGVTAVTIVAKGAQGGGNISGPGGKGASVQGDFAVNPGDVLRVLVGQMPVNTAGYWVGSYPNAYYYYYNYNGGGGGGSFVWNQTTGNTLYIAAGGGGGNAAYSSSGSPGSSTATPTPGLGAGSGAGGTAGNGGAGGGGIGYPSYPGTGGGWCGLVG
jgi:hypothetical protein